VSGILLLYMNACHILLLKQLHLSETQDHQ